MKRFSLACLIFVISFGSILIEAQNPAMDTPAVAPLPSTPFPKHAPVLPQKSVKPSSHENLKAFPHVPARAKANDDSIHREGSWMPDQAGVLDKTVRDQLKALNEGDPSLAYYGFGSNAFKKSVSLETFRQFVATNRILSVHRTMEIEKPIFKGIVAKVRVKLANGNEAVRLEYEFIQENGAWKVNRLDILRNGF